MVNKKEFNESLEKQKSKARQNWSGTGSKATDKIWFDILSNTTPTDFLGYEEESGAAIIHSIVVKDKIVNTISVNDEAVLILNQTTFYGESGGQIGDTGIISTDDCIFEVTDTKKKLGLHLHYGKVKKGNMKNGDSVTLEINISKRNSLRSYHTATHLLHQSLRDTLGDHVTQKGSLVSYDRLRFDFSHHKQISKEEVDKIESIVDNKIAQNYPVWTQSMKPEDAIKMGALALFGEKYGDEVRVIFIGADKNDAYSIELCGGTHVKQTGEIGKFKIISNSSVAAGIRRIEAIRDTDVDEYESELSIKEKELLEVNRIKEDQINIAKQEKQNDQLIDTFKEVLQTSANPGQKTSFSTKNNDDITLSFILNMLDGIYENPGRIIILTSNYYDKLDSALKRFGRIDISLRLGYVELETVKEFYHYYYNEKIPKKCEKKLNIEELTPAEMVNIRRSCLNKEDFIKRLIQR